MRQQLNELLERIQTLQEEVEEDYRQHREDFLRRRIFEPLGMDLYRITPSGYLFKMEHYYETKEQFRTTNFLAVRR